MPAIFEKLGMRKPQMSAFDLSREQKLSFNMGELIPNLVQEILPGDELNVSTEAMLRMAPMLAPIMHRVNLTQHFFFVPNRLIWPEWEDFITGGKEGTSAPIPPTTLMSGLNTAEKKRLADYLGLPTQMTGDFSVSALPFRAYQLIWSEYYRDENLEDPYVIGTNSTDLKRRAWEKDYFTSALPWLQRGPAVGIPVDVEYSTPSTITPHVSPQTGTLGYNNIGQLVDTVTGNTKTLENIATDLEFTINELRKSSALQRWLEKQARGGYRYIETILSHFGVRSEDARLQRPEFLGGGKLPIVISEVLNTTGTEDSAQGDMAGHGISVGQTMSFKKRFTEHGFVMGIMSVTPRTAYYQGIPKMFLRTDKTDYYWPEFANLGEQEIKGVELYLDPNPANNNKVFGYQQRYAEYKYAQSTVHGDFKSSLEFWHLGRKFASSPNLNADFTKCNPSDRIFAVQESAVQKLWCQLYHKVHARRPMPFFADPRLS